MPPDAHALELILYLAVLFDLVYLGQGAYVSLHHKDFSWMGFCS